MWQNLPPVEHTLPACLGGEAHSHFAAHRRAPVFDRYLARLGNARLEGDEGLLFLADGSVLLEHHFFWREYVVNQPGYYRRKAKPRIIEGPVFPLIGFGPGAYYHWLTDTLYRLYEVIDALPPETKYLVSTKTTPTQLEALAAFGVPAQNLVQIQPGDFVQLADLWYAPPIMPSGFHLRRVTNWLSERLCGALLAKTPVGAGRRIYVSRADAARRKVVNENLLLKLLEASGFETVFCEGLDLAAQAELFSRADMVVAPHGAGLTNLLFVPAGNCHVLELIGRNVPRGSVCYWSLCQARELDYTYVSCDEVASASGYMEPDICVPLEHVESWLRERCQERVDQIAGKDCLPPCGGSDGQPARTGSASP